MWYDLQQTRPGDDISEDVKQGIQASDIVFVVWSQNAAQSKWVNKEMSQAMLLRKTIIGILVDDTPWYSYLQNLNIPAQDWRQNYQNLFMRLNIVLLSQQHQVLKCKGEEWSILNTLLTQMHDLDGVTQYLNAYRRQNNVSGDKAYWIQRILDVCNESYAQGKQVLDQLQGGMAYAQELVDRIEQSLHDQYQLQEILAEIEVNEHHSPMILGALKTKVKHMLASFDPSEQPSSLAIKTVPSELSVEAEETPDESGGSVWLQVGKYAAMGLAAYGICKMVQGASNTGGSGGAWEDQVARSLNSMGHSSPF
ncbi:toll/interleukin-1 receptor domain-containing protein [Acaryochloris marina]|uniref:toll/interleukin-1 receptor domain-containing protein n=1 Tax=Acaryochloris marina TaxID=155978 RepID=UPI002016BF14|nr:toll/interleukin-1 receptor domain-containing protein [Acaryochloris marina]